MKNVSRRDLLTGSIVALASLASVRAARAQAPTATAGPADPKLIEDLVAANRILVDQGVVDGYGHVSVRHDRAADRYLMSRSIAPELVTAADIMEYDLDSVPVDPRGRTSYLERFIHGEIYEARPDVQAVVHNHSPAVIPFGITGAPLRPVMHMCASMGAQVPVWDSRTSFGDTNLLVTAMPMARDLAATLGPRPVALMRGHGCVVAGGSLREVVFNAIYLQLNADLQLRASALGEITFLTEGEIAAVLRTRSSFT